MPEWRTLTQELEELERSNPEVKAAADNYDRTVRRILRAAERAKTLAESNTRRVG